MAAHDGMSCMNLIQRATLIFYIRTQEARRELILHFFDSIFVGITKEKPDHAIFEYAIDEGAHDLSELLFPAQLGKEARLRRLNRG